MPLQRQRIAIPLTAGQEQLRNARLVTPGAFIGLENVEHDEVGALTKRRGYAALAMTEHIADGAITGQTGLISHESSLVALGGIAAGTEARTSPEAWQYTPDGWRRCGDIDPCLPSVRKVGAPRAGVTGGDVALNNGYLCYVSEAKAISSNDGITDGIYVSVTKTDGTPIMVDYFISGAYTGVKVVAVGAYFSIWAADEVNTALKVWYINTSTPTTVVGPADAVTDLSISGTNFCYDIEALSTDEVLLVYVETGLTALAKLTDHAGTVAHTASGLAAAGPCACYEAADSGDNRYCMIAWSSVSTGEVQLTALQITDLAHLDTHNTTLVTSAAAVGGACDLDNGTVHAVVFGDRYIRAEYNGVAISTAYRSITTGKPIVSKPYFHNGRPYWWSVEHKDNQNVYHLRSVSYASTTDRRQVPVAKALQTRAETPAIEVQVSHVVDLGDDTYICSVQRQERLQSVSGAPGTGNVDTSAAVGLVANHSPGRLSRADIGGSLYIGGGYVRQWDGDLVGLFGFDLYPVITAVSGGSTGGSMSDGTYSYKLVWEWTDRTGRLHRSAPSAAFSVTLSGGGTEQKATVSFYPLRDCSSTKDIRAVVYRTANGGTVYYRTGAAELNDNDSNGLQIVVDTESDADLTDNEILYTTGGSLDAASPPPSNIMVAWRDRLCLVPSDDPTTIWTSKPLAAGAGPELSELLTVRVPSGGDITALAVLQDRLVIFKQRKIYHIYGDGPSATGSGVFSPPTLLADEIGAIDQASVVETPLGVLFKSKRGWYLLTQSMQPVYVGSAVVDYDGYDVTSAVHLEDRQQVRITLDGSSYALVWSYQLMRTGVHQQATWMVFSNHAAYDATIYDGDYCMLKTSGVVWQQSTDYQDAGSNIQAIIDLPWVHIAGINGAQRVRSMVAHGEIDHDGAGSIKAKCYRDGRTTADDDGSPYSITAANAVYFDVDELFSFEAHISKQKCESMRTRVYDVDNPGIFKLVAFGYEIMIKKGNSLLARGQGASAAAPAPAAPTAPAAPAATGGGK